MWFRLEGKSVFRTSDNPFGELAPHVVEFADRCSFRPRYVHILRRSLLLTCFIVGVTGSGRGVTEYERMGKHKFDTNEDD